nr:unnamed protein product [Digitaria exilis]
MAAAVFFPADGRRSSHFDATFRSSTRRSTAASEMVAEPTGKASLPCRISRETTRSSSPSVKGSAATKRRSSFHTGPPPFPRANAGVVRVLSAWNPSVARTATPASRGGAAAVSVSCASITVSRRSQSFGDTGGSGGGGGRRRRIGLPRVGEGLVGLGAGPRGDHEVSAGEASPAFEPVPLRGEGPVRWVTGVHVGGVEAEAAEEMTVVGDGHVGVGREISKVGPGESVSVSRTNAKVWSHSKKAPRRASRVDAWRPPAATRTCGCAPAGSPRARTTRTNRYDILSTRSCLLRSIAGVSSGTGGGGRRTGIDTCRGITGGGGATVCGGGGCSSSGCFSSDAASSASGSFSSGAGVAAAAGSASSGGFSMVDPSPAGAGVVSSTVFSGSGGSSAGVASLLGASLASGGGGASASAAAAGGSGSGGGGGGGRGTSR